MPRKAREFSCAARGLVLSNDRAALAARANDVRIAALSAGSARHSTARARHGRPGRSSHSRGVVGCPRRRGSGGPQGRPVRGRLSPPSFPAFGPEANEVERNPSKNRKRPAIAGGTLSRSVDFHLDLADYSSISILRTLSHGRPSATCSCLTARTIPSRSTATRTAS